MIIIDQPGPLTTIQDLGRPGLAHLGVSPSGAADRTAHRLANRLVGNPESRATLETTLGGLTLTAADLVWVAVTGSPTGLLINGRSGSSHCPFALSEGDRLVIQPPAQGVRNYLAVRGGIKIAKTLGSRSTDLLSGLGPAPLEPGQQLRVGHTRQRMPDVDQAPPNEPRKVLTVRPGPRRDWFTDSAWAEFLQTTWTATADGNRVAVRLDGPRLTRRITAELPSEGLIRGAVQVPASGQPLIFLADHPVTGGYPVIAVLTDRSADHAAQLRPGDQVRFGL